MAVNPIISYVRLHGWGVVASEDSDLNTLIGVDNVAGTAAFSIVGTTNLWDLSQVGSEVWVEGVPGLEDSFYTLYTMFNIPGFTYIYIKGDPDKFNATVGGLPSGAIARIEDHYKICNAIPDWVTGSSARSRWYTQMIDITPTISAEIKLGGGVAKVDGMTVTHNRVFDGDMSKIRWNVMNDDENILTATRIWNPNSIQVDVSGGIPYMASSASPNTPPALGLYEPTWWGSECIRVDSASGSGPYQIDITRSLLRTTKWFHPYGQLFFDGFTTPAGKLAEVFTISTTGDRYDDAVRICFGPVTDIGFDNAVTTQQLAISSDLLNLATRPAVKEEATADVGDASVYGYAKVAINQVSNEFTWGWIQAKDLLIRLSKSETSSYNLRPVVGSNESLSTEAGRVYGKNQVTQTINREVVTTIGGRLRYNGILTKRTSGDDFVGLQVPTPIPPPPVGAESNERQQWEGEWSGYYLTNLYGFADDYTPDDDQHWGFIINKMQNDGFFDEVKPAHVFEGERWPVGGAFPNEYTISRRRIQVNPIEVLLQIMFTRWGDQTNSFTYEGLTYNFDFLPPELGLALKPDDVDLGSFIQTAWKFYELGFNLSNCFINAEDTGKLSKWITSNILEPYFLAIVTDEQGRIKLVELADSKYKTGMTELTDDDLFVPEGSSDPVELSYDAANLLGKITYKFERPWINGNDPLSKQTVNYFYARDGLAAHYRNLPTDLIEIQPDFAPFTDVDDERNFETYIGRMLANRRHIMPIITVYVDENWPTVGGGGGVGDFISVDLSRIPNSLGLDVSNLQAVGLVAKRQRDILTGVDKLDLVIVETLDLTATRNFSASVEVDTGSTGTVIQVDPNTFLPGDLSLFATAQDSFEVGDELVLYDQYMTRKSFNTVLMDVISATEIEIDTDFEDGGGSPIVPTAGDIIVLKQKSTSTAVSEVANQFVFSTRATAQQWETS